MRLEPHSFAMEVTRLKVACLVFPIPYLAFTTRHGIGGPGQNNGSGADGYSGKTPPWFQNGGTKSQYMQSMIKWRNRIDCAAKSGQDNSLAALLFPGSQNSFIGNLLGGNAASGIASLLTLVFTPGATQSGTDVLTIDLNGAGQGLPCPSSSPGCAGAVGLGQYAVVKTVLNVSWNSVTGVTGQITELGLNGNVVLDLSVPLGAALIFGFLSWSWLRTVRRGRPLTPMMRGMLFYSFFGVLGAGYIFAFGAMLDWPQGSRYMLTFLWFASLGFIASWRHRSRVGATREE